MSSWKPLLAACCLALTVSPAFAAVTYRGLSHTESGAAVLDVTPDQRLLLSNIGSSGQDGVDVACPGLDGTRFVLDATRSVDDGTISASFSWRQVGGPQALHTTSLSCVSDASGVTLSSSFSSSSSSLHRVRCLSNGELVHDALVSSSSSVSVASPPGGCPMPSLSCAYDRSSGEQRCVAEFSSSLSVTVGGSLVVCDAVMFSVEDGDDEDCDGISSSLRVTCPSGSSLSSLACDRVDFVSHHHFLSGEGQALVDPPSGLPTGKRLHLSNIGSSGQDGVSVHRSPGSGGGGGGGACSPSTCGLAGACRLHFAPPSLSFDPRVDEGKGCVTRVLGTSSSSPSLSVLGSFALTITGSNFRATPSFSGMAAQAESVVVYDRGVEVYRGALSSGSSFDILPPPGEPLGMAINEKGLPGEKKVKKKSTTVAQPGPGRAQPLAAQSVADYDFLPIEVGFSGRRVLVFGGLQVTGDLVVCWGERAPTGTGSSLRVSSQQCLVRCASSSSSTSVELVDVSSSSGDLVSLDAPPSSCLSTSSSCVAVPVVIERTDATPVRAYTVTFHLSPELAQCVTGVTEGDYLSRVASTQMFVTDNGGGSYTVDCGTLGPVCGSTGDGELFRLHLSAAAPSPGALGSVVIDQVTLRDCTNGDVPGSPGSSAHLPVDFAAPSSVSSLAVSQVPTGNGSSGTTRLHVSHGQLDLDAGLALYHRSFGGYPEYDDDPAAGPPSPPASPADALSQGWSLADVDRDGLLDVAVAGRGFHYFVAFATDACGNSSSPSSRTDGTLNYHLGDVSDGVAACSGNNGVGPEDISLLGAHYGSSLSFGSPVACLDVGPTSDRSVHGRPMTDNRIGFEDFMMFAINYASVSAPHAAAAPVAAAANALSLEVPSLPGPGATFDAVVRADGAGDVQALSLRLAFDPAVLEQVSVAAGGLLEAQGREALVLSPASGVVDAALLGAGAGLSGSGDLVRVTFRVKAAGDPALSLAGVTARDGRNETVAIGTASAGPAPARAGLAAAFPNPFAASTEVRFGLPAPARVTLGVFDVAGRRVRTLLDGTQPAGERSVSWDGRDDAGLRLAPGAYVVRFESGALHESRMVRLVR